MRRKTLRRQLVALGHEPFTPTDLQREMVRTMAFNRVPHERIARIMRLALEELLFHFQRELELGEEEILAQAAANLIRLANQDKDLKVALHANETILRARLAVWREPKAVEPQQTSETKRISDMSLEEVEAELARLKDEEDRAAGATDRDPPRSGKPH